jgi:uncharacterized small protein (DUF1192 family)
MAYDWKSKVDEFVAQPTLSNAAYCVSVETVETTAPCVRWIGAYLCTIPESDLNHCIDICILDENGGVLRGDVLIRWGWADQRANEPSPPFYCNKGEPEVPGILDLWGEKYKWVEVASIGSVPILSERITGMTGEIRDNEPDGHYTADWMHRRWIVVGQVYCNGAKPVLAVSNTTAETVVVTGLDEIKATLAAQATEIADIQAQLESQQETIAAMLATLETL